MTPSDVWMDTARQLLTVRVDGGWYAGGAVFNINGWELIVVMAMALVVFGPDGRPKAIGHIGHVIVEANRMVRGATAAFTREIEAAVPIDVMIYPHKEEST